MSVSFLAAVSILGDHGVPELTIAARIDTLPSQGRDDDRRGGSAAAAQSGQPSADQDVDRPRDLRARLTNASCSISRCPWQLAIGEPLAEVRRGVRCLPAVQPVLALLSRTGGVSCGSQWDKVIPVP